jgi:hypothetical protein
MLYERERKEMFNEIKRATSRNYDFALMRNDQKWMMEALFGCNIGNDADRRLIRMAVGRFLRNAYVIRRCSLGLGTEEVP